MRTVELFSATESFSNVMRGHEHETCTYELNPVFKPDHVVYILTMPTDMVMLHSDILWASPPCQGFSVAAIGSNWSGGPRGYIPKSDSAHLSIALAKKTLEIIEQRKPKWWFIENPQGLLKKMDFMQEFATSMHTIWYCHYGDSRAKPTNIWTNAYWWKPQPPCHNRRKGHPNDCCCTDHESAPRGARTGTQGIKGDRDRSRIPPALFEEILAQMPIKI